MTRTLHLSLLASLLLTLTVLGGCSSSPDSQELRGNWSPELYSAAETYDQYWNDRTIHRTNYVRQIHDDWAGIWFENRNLRMTRFAMP